MTAFNPTLGSSFERAHPDDLLRRMAEVREPEVHIVPREAREQSSGISTAAKTIGGTVGATLLSAGTAKVLNDPPEVLKNVGQTLANGTSKVADGVSRVAGSIFGGIQGAYGWWKFWYDWTPAPLHYGVVVAGVAVAGAAVMIPLWMASSCYRMVRYPSGYIPVGGGGTNTNNIAFHVYNAGQVPAGCTPNFQATKDDKGNHVVQMGYVCEPSSARTPAEVYERRAPLRAIHKKETAEEHHLKLQEYQRDLTDNKITLSDKVQEDIAALVEELSQIEENSYADSRVPDLIKRTGPLLVQIQKELEGRDYHKRISTIVDHQLSLLNNRSGIHEELVGIKARFDAIAADWNDVKRQEIIEVNKKAAKILLRAEKEIKERNHTNVARAVHIMRKRAAVDDTSVAKKAKKG